MLRKHETCIWVFTRGQFCSSGMSLPSSVVCVYVCLLSITSLCAITHQPFKLEPSHLDKICKTHWFRSLLFLLLLCPSFPPGQIHNHQSKYTHSNPLRGEFVLFSKALSHILHVIWGSGGGVGWGSPTFVESGWHPSPVHLLFSTVYWPRQPRVLRRLTPLLFSIIPNTETMQLIEICPREN